MLIPAPPERMAVNAMRQMFARPALLLSTRVVWHAAITQPPAVDVNARVMRQLGALPERATATRHRQTSSGLVFHILNGEETDVR